MNQPYEPQAKRISKMLTPAQASFIDFIEEHGYVEFITLTVMRGDPVAYTKAIKKGRFDLTQKMKPGMLNVENSHKP